MTTDVIHFVHIFPYCAEYAHKLLANLVKRHSDSPGELRDSISSMRDTAPAPLTEYMENRPTRETAISQLQARHRFSTIREEATWSWCNQCRPPLEMFSLWASQHMLAGALCCRSPCSYDSILLVACMLFSCISWNSQDIYDWYAIIWFLYVLMDVWCIGFVYNGFMPPT